MITYFSIFENKENFEVIATNHSSYNWEYDNSKVTAQILLDKSDNNTLYLKLRKVHVKTGLGAGTYPSDLEFIKIGTLQKADLALVRSLLKKHGYEQQKFSKFWEDEDGNRMSLTDMLKLRKPKRVLKNIKSISDFDSQITTKQAPKYENEDVELIQYSEKSYALFGEGTKAIKDELKALGCKFNPFLKDPKTGAKRAGWIFPIGKLEQVKDLI
jgi:hypothetical protein